ncbi:MAG: class I SAM-dependent methyltransferase [Verrucomicrobia bacterium]|nr:class I SAM-dependent methyltransferase [Verrucomicrobiota bacterium]
MATAKDHYDSHLAPIYTWMRGGAAGPRRQFAEFLRDRGLLPSRPEATALDLGAGSGFQTLPLAEAGYTVTALDFSEILLAELAHDAAAAGVTHRIRPILGDMRELSRHGPSPAPELIVCLGDTLTHLTSTAHVTRLISDATAALARGGHLVLGYRDYSLARHGADRFIPVRSEADRIFTCFLEYGQTHLTVHDIVHVRDGAGWNMKVSVFEKIRLDPAFLRDRLRAAGLTLVHDEVTAGTHTVIARKT